jgi:hypothetical protein
VRRRPGSRLFILMLATVGATLGIALTLAAGGVCSDGVSESFCGLNFLVWNLSSGAALAASAALGALIGTVVGLGLTLTLGRRTRPSGAG